MPASTATCAAGSGRAITRRPGWTSVTERSRAVPTIRAIKPGDREPWQVLWNGYLRFYRQHLPQEITDATFARLLDERVQPHGLVAERDGKLVGFVHSLFHPTTWSQKDSCYLEDLYVDPAARRRDRAQPHQGCVRQGRPGQRGGGLLDDPGVQRRGPRALRHRRPAHLLYKVRALTFAGAAVGSSTSAAPVRPRSVLPARSRAQPRASRSGPPPGRARAP